MSFTRIMGIHVNNDAVYQQYRTHMLPILHHYKGTFGYDFRVSEVLISKTDTQINRVFTIEFPSEETMNKFFNDLKYQEVKQTYLISSVESTTTIALVDSKNAP